LFCRKAFSPSPPFTSSKRPGNSGKKEFTCDVWIFKNKFQAYRDDDSNCRLQKVLFLVLEFGPGRTSSVNMFNCSPTTRSREGSRGEPLFAAIIFSMLWIQIRSDPVGSETFSRIRIRQPLSGMNLKQNFYDKIHNFSTRLCIRFRIRYHTDRR
jgi:hypothetical protein